MKLNLLLTASLLFLASCGDLFMSEKKEIETTLDQFAGCELDTEAFSYILEKNIKGDILCLEEKLNLFIAAVRTDRPGFISQKVLNEFILYGPINIEPKVTDIVDALFDLSYLIQGGTRGYISRTELKDLFKLTRYFNERVWKVYKYFKSDEPVNYIRHLRERKIVSNEIGLIVDKVQSIFKKNRSKLNEIDTEELISKLISDNPDSVEKIRSLMFLKRVFLGGDRYNLTYKELYQGLDIAPELIKIAFDIVKYPQYNFQDKQQTLIRILQDDLFLVRNNIASVLSENDVAFSSEDILTAVVVNVSNVMGLDLSKYLREFIKVKSILLENEEHPDFLVSEFHQLIDIGEDYLNQLSLFYRVYNYFRDDLDSPGPVTINFGEFPVNNSEEQRLLNEFARISTGYRFIKGSFKIPFYSHEYGRNPDGYAQIAGIELVIQKIMKKYGRSHELARGGYDMDLDQSTQLVYDFKWILKDLGIIKIGKVKGQEIQGIASNLLLMSTLFQNQSDGCAGKEICMETVEITEFVMGVITALTVKDFFTDTMLEFCQDSLDEFDRIEPSCFRNNFINVVEEPIPGDGRSLADYMPQFYSYLRELIADVPEGEPNTSSKDYLKFILTTEQFTRSCMFYDDRKEEEVPLLGRDAFAVFAGLLNVEGTLLRLDSNKNNILDGIIRERGQKNEVLWAYENVYKGSIKALIDPDGGFMTRFSKPIF